MFNKKKGRASDSDSENGGHSDRPWVYFMIDSFFLVTQFFVLTFQLRTTEDLVIPHKLPPSGRAWHYNDNARRYESSCSPSQSRNASDRTAVCVEWRQQDE